MKKMIALTLICLVSSIAEGLAQRDTALLSKNLELAHRLRDLGRWDESVELLYDADTLDPSMTALWHYERGYVRYLQGDWDMAIWELRRAARFRDASEDVFRMLAECYDKAGKPETALNACNRGLAKFPGSGRLFNRMGKTYAGMGENGAARAAFTEGLVVEPLYVDNWFDAAGINFTSADRAYGMVNGETAVCLEGDSERAAEMCDTLLATYRRNITFQADTTVVSGFSLGVFFDNNIPFSAVYETVLSYAAAGMRSTDIPSLIEIRLRFIGIWFGMELDKAYPCALFDYHRAMIEAGFFEAWNYRLFGWPPGNDEVLEALNEWLAQNPIMKP